MVFTISNVAKFWFLILKVQAAHHHEALIKMW